MVFLLCAPENSQAIKKRCTDSIFKRSRMHIFRGIFCLMTSRIQVRESLLMSVSSVEMIYKDLLCINCHGLLIDRKPVRSAVAILQRSQLNWHPKMKGIQTNRRYCETCSVLVECTNPCKMHSLAGIFMNSLGLKSDFISPYLLGEDAFNRSQLLHSLI